MITLKNMAPFKLLPIVFRSLILSLPMIVVISLHLEDNPLVERKQRNYQYQDLVLYKEASM
ncbi:hypothetical protein FRACYDRAFT_268364 [Fragilariopsis cylindrus CCMP1102]|uniref:Uncharacterized protein n=1 Tax=Fragilariopsis cylindrus CCMP1102 TaxID=635003 RepID=A0A1E7FLC4_9STRA|nr:hypothetical protein FRACYDRAFT_268364 [Fragilariopsis cylindrus CCMP1102]|eukprot:OEU18593.1 hypothetical protein FRACYDRAFT_268364 [Fragilariopsis cylindrus CCMP1102]